MIRRVDPIVAISVVGLAVSTYLTLTHYAAGIVPLACSATGVINCAQVTSSAASQVGPIPVAALGLAWFAVMLAWAARPRHAALIPEAGALLWAGLGLLFVLYLIYAELFLIGAICLWCTVVHISVIAIFLLTLDRSTAQGDG